MDDFISREAAYKTLTEYYHHSSGVQHTVLREALNRVPTADVRPVVHGEWVYEEPNGANNFKGCYWCDQCHQPINHKKNFCPNCGADMREVKADG